MSAMEAFALVLGAAAALGGWVTFALGAVHLWVALYATLCLLGHFVVIWWLPR